MAEAESSTKWMHEDSPELKLLKQLSLKNGCINKMTKEEIKDKLADFKLDTRGNKDVLKRRLKMYYKKDKLKRPPNPPKQKYDYYVVIDFEATCQECNPQDYRHEIIEFPAILVSTKEKKVISEFHEFVRPVLQPILTPFCTELTGIQQSQVNAADEFKGVLSRMQAWMQSFNLGTKGNSYAIVTDGPWDMSRFMYLQCLWCGIPIPLWAHRWVNLRKTFCNFYKVRRAKLATMLENLGMEFEGQEHSGLDDSRNITRVLMYMLEDGGNVRINEEIRAYKVNHVNGKVNLEVTCVAEEKGDAGGEVDGESAMLGNDPVAAMSEELGQISLHNTTSHATHNPAPSSIQTYVSEDEDGFHDLLSYYALQKS